MIVDSHTHFFGPVFFRTLAAAADPAGRPEPGLARLRAARIELPSEDEEDHARRWIDEMDRNHVARMISFASIPEEAASVARGARAAGGRLVPFCLVNPGAPGAADRVRELAEEHGMRGLVLFPAMHRFDLSDPGLSGFYREVERLGLPLIVHMGILRVRVRDILGLPSDFDLAHAVPSRLRGAAVRHPGVRFVIPHFGGGYFRETLALAAACPNVAVDTSSSNDWSTRGPERIPLVEVFRRALDVLGPERIHFGTDSSVFPRGWRRDILEAQRLAMGNAGYSPEDRARVLGGNTAALLGLGSG